MCAMASIDIPAMSSLVSAADGASSELPYDQWGFSSILSQAGLDTSPSSGIGKVADWLNGAIPGLKRRLALAQAIEAQKPGQTTTVQIDESLISNVPPSQAQADGQAAAKQLRDANGKVDPKLLAEIQKYQNDPYFAAGFATELTPSDLSQIVQAESNQKPGASGSYYGTNYAADLKNWQNSYGSLLSAMGTTVATATRNTGSLALPSGYGQQWVDTITEDIPQNGGHARYGQAAALSLLLRYGSYGTDFLNTVSSGVYNYETKTNQDGMWHNRSWADNTFEGVYAPDGSQLSDPMASIMTGLSHNADAAQQFFSQGGTVNVKINGKDVPVNARMKYLIEDRTWSPDKGSDNGDGLGAALQTAATWYRDNSPQGKVSASIAGQTFALIGSYTGHGKSDGGLFGIGSHQGWEMWDGMRTHVANMVASYAPDLIRIAGVANPSPTDWNGTWVVSDPDNSLFPPNGPASAWMDPALMQKLLGTLGQDPKNLDIVNAGVAASGRIMLDYAAQRGIAIDPNAAAHIIAGSQGVPALTGASGALAYALNFTISAGYQGDKSNQEFQKQRAENISKVLGIVLSVPSLDIPEGHEWTGFLIDQIKDQALDKIGEGPDQNAQDTYNDTSADYQTKLQELTLDSLLRNGYFSDANYKLANSPAAPNEYVSPFDKKYAGQDPPAVTRDADGNLTFNFGSQAFRDWQQDGQAVNTWLQGNVTGPFRSNLPAYGG